MAVRISGELRQGYVFVKFEGPETYEEVHRFWKDLLQEGEFRDQKIFLVAAKPARALDRCEAEMLCLELTKMARGKIIAYVNPDEKDFENIVTGATIMTNRGINNKVFKSEREAEEWIGQYIEGLRREPLPEPPLDPKPGKAGAGKFFHDA